MAVKTTSKPLWVNSLNRILSQTSNPRPRLAIVGVGHELRGDDAAGLAVARALKPDASEQLLVIEAGTAPENFTSALRRFALDLVLIVDAVQANAPPGTIQLFDIDDTEICSATTHTLSYHMLASYLEDELHCRLKLLGIQPAQDALGATLSPAVRRGTRLIVRELRRVFQTGQTERSRA